MNPIGIQAVKLTNKSLYDTEQQWLEAFAKNYHDLLLETFLKVVDNKVSQDTIEELKKIK